MTESRWRLIERLYHTALERAGPERAAFLDDACGTDAELRREVASLVAADDEAATFLGESALLIAAGDIDSDAAALVGRRLGSYELLAHVGSGGMGDVYRARDVRLDRHVAIKVLAPQLACDATFLDRFAREARAISHLSHRNICALHDVGREDASAEGEPAIHYLVLEFLEGDTLAERLRAGRMPPHESLQRAIEIADALAHAHRHGIVHGDLKPGNIILTETGATLVDFGLATRPADSRPILGTLPYMSPEQIDGTGVDARADVWAFGLVFYEMLTGRRAFGGASEAAIAARIRGGEPDPLGAPDVEVPPGIDALIRSCLAKNRDERHLTAHDIADRLREIADSIGPRASVHEHGLRMKRPAVWRVAATLIAAAAVVTAAIETRRLFPVVFEKAPAASARTGIASASLSSARLRPVAAVVRPVSGVDRDLADVTTSSLEAYRFYAEGVNLHERGRDVEATAQLQRAVRIEPNFAMALAKLAITEASGPIMDMAAARRHSQRAFEQSDRLSDRERLYVEAIYRRYHGDVAGSIRSLRSVLALDPNHISSRQTLAATYQELERYREAAAHYEDLRERGVPLGNSYIGLSQTYQALGEFDKAIDVVQEFVRRNPDDARGYRRLGEALVAAGRLEEAAQAVERANGLGLNPGEEDHLRRIILLLQDRLPEVEAADRARLKPGENDASRKHADSFRLASDLLFRGRSAEARRIFAAIGARYWVALLWLEQGDAARALAEIQRGRPADDTHRDMGPEELSIVARAHARLGHRNEAASAIARLSALSDRMTTAYGDRRLRLARGVSALELHDVPTAIRELREALALLPPNPMERGVPILYALGCAYLAAGREVDAAASFERLVASSARTDAPLEFIRSLYFLGQIAERRGNRTAAREHYERFVRYWGDADLDRDRVADARRKLARTSETE